VVLAADFARNLTASLPFGMGVRPRVPTNAVDSFAESRTSGRELRVKCPAFDEPTQPQLDPRRAHLPSVALCRATRRRSESLRAAREFPGAARSPSWSRGVAVSGEQV
jgi:hypothetical protein